MPRMNHTPLRAPMSRPQASRRAARLRRLGLMVAFATLFFSIVAGFCAGKLDRFDDRLASYFYADTAAMGLRVTDVTLDGRQFTSREDILAALNVREGAPIMAFDPVAAREALESLPRITSAEVERRLPDTISIRLVERAPMAIWQKNGKMVLIDHDGIVLGDSVSDYTNLPMVVGDGAAKEAAAILEAVAAEPALAKRVSAYIRVGGRRWDLRIDNKVEVKLPETDAANAVHKIALLETKNGLLERDVVAVDLRLPGKMVVETSQPRDPKRKQVPQQGI